MGSEKFYRRGQREKNWKLRVGRFVSATAASRTKCKLTNTINLS
jgi:hypothetical protein